jgi:hypothetical protein
MVFFREFTQTSLSRAVVVNDKLPFIVGTNRKRNERVFPVLLVYEG